MKNQIQSFCAWVCSFLILVSISVTFAPQSAFAGVHWGNFFIECDGGTSGHYWSRLWDIPWPQDWESTCYSTLGNPDGQGERYPDQCDNKAGEYGVWRSSYIPECAPYWKYIDYTCGGWAEGKGVYVSHLMNIHGSWEEACKNTVGNPSGAFSEAKVPDFCNQQLFDKDGVGGMYGYWYASDSNCHKRSDSCIPLSQRIKNCEGPFGQCKYKQGCPGCKVGALILCEAYPDMCDCS